MSGQSSQQVAVLSFLIQNAC